MSIDMGMVGMFWAFSQQDTERMDDDNDLIGKFTEDSAKEQKEVFSIGDAWELFDEMFKDVIFIRKCGVRGNFSDYFSFEPILLSADKTREVADNLSEWTHEKVLNTLQRFSIKDVHNLESFKTDTGKESLLRQFDELVGFFRRAAEQNWGVIFAVCSS